MTENELTHIPLSEKSVVEGREIREVQVDYDEVLVFMEDGTIRYYPWQCDKCGYTKPSTKE